MKLYSAHVLNVCVLTLFLLSVSYFDRLCVRLYAYNKSTKVNDGP